MSKLADHATTVALFTAAIPVSYLLGAPLTSMLAMPVVSTTMASAGMTRHDPPVFPSLNDQFTLRMP